MNLKNTGIYAGVAAVVIILYSLWLWQPERQVLKHHEHFLKAVSNRNWTRFAGFLDDKYTDRWGHDRAGVLSDSREVLSQFFTLTLTGESTDCAVDGNTGTVSCRLRMQGAGTPVAESAVSEVNSLAAPFTFKWTRQSWKPWDWKLMSVDNPQLNIPQG